jgi:putative ABC transport system permease protein
MSWLRYFRRNKWDAERAREMEAHLAIETEENIARGMAPEDARYAAIRKLGNRTLIREEVYRMNTIGFVETLWQDIRYGVRMLRRNPGFTAVAVMTLALGIGANTAIFSVVDGILLSPLPYRHPDEIVAATHNDSLMNVIDIQREAKAFSAGGGINVIAMDYTGGTEPVQVHVGLVDAGFLETFGVPPMLGRIISLDEDVKGGPRIAVVSHRFWQTYMGSDPHAVGRAILLNGNSYGVIGVMPGGFAPPNEHPDVFVTLWAGYPEAALYRGVHFLHVYWRLKPGVALAQAQGEMSEINHRFGEQYPETEKERRTTLVPLHEWLTGDIRPALLVLSGAVGIVLLIACSNFAGLLMARSVARHQELVVRSALGAGRGRQMRQALTESALLSLIGGAAGLLLAKWGTTALLSLKPAALERFTGIEVDARVLIFVFGVSAVTGIVFGLWPAWSAGRASVVDTLKESGRSSTSGHSGYRLRQILVTGEIALALVLLTGAGLLMMGFSRMQAVDPGFNPANVATIELQLPKTRYEEIPKQTQFRRELLSRLNALPGVQAAMITDIPLGGAFLDHRFVIDGRPRVPVGEEPQIQTLSVMGNYFHLMEIPIRAGRDFTETDREGQPLVAIVNEAAVRKFFPSENPMGARIDWIREDGPKWMTIVGVAADVKYAGLNQPVDPAVYTPFPQSDEAWRRWMTLVIRTPSSSAGLIEEVKKQVWSLDRQIPVSNVQSMEELVSVSLAEQRFNMLLLGIFAGLALILSGVGIYGLMSYSVSQRTREIGVRVALGAQRADVMRLVVAGGANLAFIGIVIGCAAALGITRVMTSLLFEVKPTDPATFAASAVVLSVVVLAACYVPAWRAMRVDPIVALRHQ